MGRYCVMYCTVSLCYAVYKWEENSKFARDMYGAHVIFVHDNVMERCGEKYANR